MILVPAFSNQHRIPKIPVDVPIPICYPHDFDGIELRIEIITTTTSSTKWSIDSEQALARKNLASSTKIQKCHSSWFLLFRLTTAITHRVPNTNTRMTKAISDRQRFVRRKRQRKKTEEKAYPFCKSQKRMVETPQRTKPIAIIVPTRTR